MPLRRLSSISGGIARLGNRRNQCLVSPDGPTRSVDFPLWKSAHVDVAVIGLGLIGGSVLRALAARGHRVLGYDADPATRATARTAAAQAPMNKRWQVTASLA